MTFRSGMLTKIGRAIDSENVEEVCALLNQHAESIEALKGKDNSPLFIACHEGGLYAVEFLVEKTNQDINEVNKDGDTPLMIARKKGNTEIVEYLEKTLKQRQELESLLKKRTEIVNSMQTTQSDIVSLETSLADEQKEASSLETARDQETIGLMDNISEERFEKIKAKIF
jgi:ankyrin repeat protein